ncbi:MAG: RNA polymerase sigma factor [Luteolibacter sp.]
MPDFSAQNDQTLLKTFVHEGNESAFSELVKRHHAMAYTTAWRICGDSAEAKDVLQQSLIVLARRAPELTKIRYIGGWLHRAVVLEAKNSIRKSARRRKRETKAHEMSAHISEAPVSQRLAPQLDETLNSMPEKDREVLTLHYLEGLTFSTISKHMGGTPEAWQKRSVRALAKLATKLRARGITATSATLAAFFLTQQTKAAVSISFLETATRTALDQTAGGSSYIATKSAIFLSMKTGLTACLLGGGLIAFGWNKMSPPIENRPPSAARGELGIEMLPVRPVTQRTERNQGFTMELVELAVSEFDSTTDPTPILESRLRSLMFIIPPEHLEEAFQILMETNSHPRFQEIVAAFFARWAEIDPQAALAKIDESGEYSKQAKRAVIITWLNTDTDSAFDFLLTEKSPENRELLREFLDFQGSNLPAEAASLVDKIGTEWPEAHPQLLQLVADLWADQDPLPAAEWVNTSDNQKLKIKVLRKMARDVARIRGFDGLAIASLIENEKARAGARNGAIYWWGVTTGGVSFTSGKTPSVRDLSSGFPDDWSGGEIRTFSQATMENYSDKLPMLLKLAKNDEQLIRIYEGAAKGVGWSNPAAASIAVERLPESFAQTKDGEKTLKTFLQRWHEMDPKAADEWLTRQSPGSKTDALRSGLNQNQSN